MSYFHEKSILVLSLAQNVTILLPEEMTANGQAGPRLFIRQKTNP